MLTPSPRFWRRGRSAAWRPTPLQGLRGRLEAMGPEQERPRAPSRGAPGNGSPGSEGPNDDLPLDGAMLPGATPCSAETANAAGYCFRSVAMGGGGFVSGIVTSPLQRNLIYARTDVGGAYRWDESTASWLPLEDRVAENQTGLLGVESLALDPSDPSRVYLLAGISYFDGGKTAVLRSDDYGATFEATEVTFQFKANGNGPGRQNGERLAVDPNDGSILFVGTRDSGLFQSRTRRRPGLASHRFRPRRRPPAVASRSCCSIPARPQSAALRARSTPACRSSACRASSSPRTRESAGPPSQGSPRPTRRSGPRSRPRASCT